MLIAIPRLDGSRLLEIGEGEGQLSLPGMIPTGSCTQVFPCFMLSANCPEHAFDGDAMCRWFD